MIMDNEKFNELSKKRDVIGFTYRIGSQCMYFKNKEILENVELLGLVLESEKIIFSVVDFALSPIIFGSDINLNMCDYIVAIINKFTIRRIDNKSIFIIKYIDDMHNELNNLYMQFNKKLVTEG